MKSTNVRLVMINVSGGEHSFKSLYRLKLLHGACQDSGGVDIGRIPHVSWVNKNSSSTLHFVCLRLLVMLVTQVTESDLNHPN